MAKLEDIGFYTLSDARAKTASRNTRLMRVEILVTGRCNFCCPYCRGIGGPDVKLEEICPVIEQMANDDLFTLRFSGGEPTVHPDLLEMVKFSKDVGVEKIALSTNGSADLEFYKKLIDAGVEDFSVSLDACCAAEAETMTGGGIYGMWDKFIENIKFISSQTYLSVGVVLNEDNRNNVNDIIKFADSLGVSDIRVIPAAQDTNVLSGIQVEKELLEKYPILHYRYKNIISQKPVRGLGKCDPSSCPLVLDDIAIMEGKHYPCVIYMREGGKEIGKIGPNMRDEREEWFKNTNTYKEPICQKNCLDVCVEHNRKWEEFHEKREA